MQTRDRPPSPAARPRARALRWLPGPRFSPETRRAILSLVLCVLAAALVAAPVVVERAVENVRFADTLGTFPVEVGLCHDGRSTLDTGILGKVFWDQTGAFGFGAYARATGPPEAGGTLASYVDPSFFQTNVAFLRHPDTVVAAYSEQIRDSLRAQVSRDELAAALIGGFALFLLVPRRRLRGVPRGHAIVASVLLVDLALGLSAFSAVKMFDGWHCSHADGEVYAARGITNPTFSSPQMSEIVSQIKPFIDKNTQRIDAAADEYEAAASTSIGEAVQRQAPALEPRSGEAIVLGEADTQGSFVGVHVRRRLYADLIGALGQKAVALRTIAGDITSNGTVAESSYVKAESTVAPDVPVAVAAGDHDSPNTWKQLTSTGFDVPDLRTDEVGGLKVSAANDPEHKTLFGGSITNPTGVTEEELGQRLRQKVGDRTGIVVLHQPSAIVGYLGLDSLSVLRDRPQTPAQLTTPYDDGIPDLPPGIVEYGHLHQAEGPWVVWNTDGDQITWTVVDQLGTAGGVENAPTFSRFSTPFSAPLKPIMVRLQYVNTHTGLQTGYATVECDLQGRCTISDRVDVGLPGGEPGAVTSQGSASSPHSGGSASPDVSPSPPAR